MDGASSISNILDSLLGCKMLLTSTELGGRNGKCQGCCVLSIVCPDVACESLRDDTVAEVVHGFSWHGLKVSGVQRVGLRIWLDDSGG